MVFGRGYFSLAISYRENVASARRVAINKNLHRIAWIRSDQIGLAIRRKFKVTLKMIACWLLYDCKGLG